MIFKELAHVTRVPCIELARRHVSDIGSCKVQRPLECDALSGGAGGLDAELTRTEAGTN